MDLDYFFEGIEEFLIVYFLYVLYYDVEIIKVWLKIGVFMIYIFWDFIFFREESIIELE